MTVDLSRFLSRASIVCFDNDPADPPADPAGDPPNDPPRVFSQDELNKILAEDKRKHKAQYEKIEAQYKTLLDKNNLSTEERVKLEESLEDVRKQLRSKEEQAKYEKKQLEDRLNQTVNELQQKVSQAESKYTHLLVTRALKDAAVGGDAFNAEQVVTLLVPHVKLVDEKPMIEFPDVDGDTGEPIVTQMSPDDAIKRMKQLPEKWGNLFKSNIVSGIGGSSNTGAGPGNGRVDVKKLTPEQYMKMRRENPSALGLRPK